MSVKPAPSAVCSLGSSPQTRAREGVREGAHPADSGRTGDLKVIGALIAAVAQGPPSCTYPHTVKTHASQRVRQARRQRPEPNWRSSCAR